MKAEKKQSPEITGNAERKRQSCENPSGVGKAERVYLTWVLLLLAVASITAATAAWFTIADHTKVNSMSLEIFSGVSLRFDLEQHDTLEEYVKTLTFEEICSRVLQEQGTDWKETALEPVTTEDYTVFTLENGTKVESSTGKYLEFTLHFMAAEDMVVHLTSADSEGREDGTRVLSETPGMTDALRISFTDSDHTAVYDPGSGAGNSSPGDHFFTLPPSDEMVYNDDNALFSLKAYQNYPVVVHVWLEGTDESCTDELRGAEYSIRLRFEGTDEENNILDGTSERREDYETEQ